MQNLTCDKLLDPLKASGSLQFTCTVFTFRRFKPLFKLASSLGEKPIYHCISPRIINRDINREVVASKMIQKITSWSFFDQSTNPACAYKAWYAHGQNVTIALDQSAPEKFYGYCKNSAQRDKNKLTFLLFTKVGYRW